MLPQYLCFCFNVWRKYVHYYEYVWWAHVCCTIPLSQFHLRLHVHFPFCLFGFVFGHRATKNWALSKCLTKICYLYTTIVLLELCEHVCVCVCMVGGWAIHGWWQEEFPSLRGRRQPKFLPYQDPLPQTSSCYFLRSSSQQILQRMSGRGKVSASATILGSTGTQNDVNF